MKENPLILAAIISLALHLTIFAGWKLNQRFGWLKNQSMPAWLQKISPKLAPANAQKLSPKLQNEAPMIFVDVDPQWSVKEPPKETKFYGAANTEATSAKTKLNAELPQVEGKQDKIFKTTEDVRTKPQPLQPSPPAPDQTDSEESKAPPKEKQSAGDLAMAKPQEQNKKSAGKSDSDEGETEKKARVRPRTLEQAKAGMIGQKMKQPGGAKRLAMEPSFDVKATSYGDYDREFIEAVRQCWFDLLEGRNIVTGKVVVEFRLNRDGRITDLKAVENTTRNVMLEIICTTAIDKPSPYREWPADMRRELKTDSRSVTFTFYYE